MIFTLNEECNAYDECDILTPFIAVGKPIFNAEYDSRYVNNASTRTNCTSYPDPDSEECREYNGIDV